MRIHTYIYIYIYMYIHPFIWVLIHVFVYLSNVNSGVPTYRQDTIKYRNVSNVQDLCLLYAKLMSFVADRLNMAPWPKLLTDSPAAL